MKMGGDSSESLPTRAPSDLSAPLRGWAEHRRFSSVETDSQPLLDALDHLCHRVDSDPQIKEEFYSATTPEQLVALAVETGILIDADDFRALLRSGSTERWFVRGGDQTNPIIHLKNVFNV
jgi:hypothetical protein